VQRAVPLASVTDLDAAHIKAQEAYNLRVEQGQIHDSSVLKLLVFGLESYVVVKSEIAAIKKSLYRQLCLACVA
jgi:hypothetical protein